MRYVKFFILLLAGYSLMKCNDISRHEAFDQKKWKSYISFDEPERDLMAEDLLNKNKLKGLTYKQMLDLLGAPTNYGDSTKTFYQLSEQFDMIDPIAGKDLIIHFNKDSIITNAEIKKWHKN